MTTGVYICNVCEQDGKPPGERFKVPADEIGVALMQQHLTDHRRPVVTAKRAAHQARLATGETP